MGVDLTKQGIWTADGNDIGENLASQYIVCGNNGITSIATAGRTNYYGDYGIIIPATENVDTYFTIWYTKPLENGKIYTLSANVSGLTDGTYYNFPLFSQSNSAMGLMKINHNGLCFITFTMNYTGTIRTTTLNNKTYYKMFMDDNGRTLASGQGSIIINNIKLEEGSVPTPWIPCTSDDIYTSSQVGFEEDNKVMIGKNWIIANNFYEF